MREIKFRGKTLCDHGMILAGSWVTGGYYMDDGYQSNPKYFKHYILTWNSGGPGGFMDRIEVDPETIGQYTGLQDKNGKGIYEGDIFEAPHDFGPGWFDVRRSVVRFHEMHGYQWNYWLTEQLEVIGNINEHPHLLTRGSEEDERDKIQSVDHR